MHLVSLDLATHLNNLGSGLRARYHRTGALADLERAIGAWEQAVAQTPTPELAGHLLNLGNGLVDRYERTRALGDLEQAVHAFEQAVTKTPPDSPDLPARLNGLGSGLMHRYMVAESPADLERAIDAWEQVVTRTPAGSVDLPAYLNSLGAGLGVRYARTEDLADLEHSIESYEQAVARAPASSPVLPGIRNNLAASLRVRYERTRMPADLERATSVYEMASKEGLKMAVEAGLHSARDWGNWASDRGAWQEAVRAYGYAAQASEWLFRIQMVRRNKEVWLRETQGLPARSAYALAKTSDLRGAVVALERGRAQLLSETLERDRVDLEALRLTDAHLYTRYQQTVERVVHLANAELREAMFPPDFDLTFEAQAARAGLDAAVEAIRHLPGHEAFLSLPVFADVKAALTPAPSPRAFIYVAATPVGTLAIVVTVEAVEDIWLTFTEADLDTLLAEREGQAATGGYLPSQLIPAWMEGALTDALPLLGERIMGPVAARIRPRGLKQVILIPAGRLALLPLHAARYQVDKTATYFLDEFAVAYSPNARTLATAQREMSRRNSQLQLVGVGNPMPHPKPLLAAQAELEEVAATLFPENASPPLYGEAATRAALLRVIPEGVYLHFACHGVFNSEDPLASRLELSGQEPLTLRDLLDGAAQPVRARLAVLSACQSALSDFRELPDEFIGLPAGFLQAGVPGVVGTLWPVDDLSTALLMVKFYELHLRGSRSGPLVPAEALRRAQQWLRDVTNGELAEYFAAHCRLDELRRRTVAHMSDATVLAGLVGFAVGDPHVRPFSQRPYFWAPFVFFGV